MVCVVAVISVISIVEESVITPPNLNDPIIGSFPNSSSSSLCQETLSFPDL